MNFVILNVVVFLTFCENLENIEGNTKNYLKNENTFASDVLKTDVELSKEFDDEFSVQQDKPFHDLRTPFTYSNYRKQKNPYEQDSILYTREVLIKQGRLKGIIRVMHPQSGLKDVEQYLGIPYAEAPISNRRFMPPGAPPPWSELRMCNTVGSVCPQILPSLNNVQNQLSKGRYDQIKRLLPYLKIENEDCLFLNLYVPSWRGIGTTPKFPIIVYIHGESYEWNSGNPYDGSVLASYGQVIVVTINYRLGILGFMKPGISEHTVSNFGILDQIAALQWVKDNIAAFGGDNRVVTLMGHGTGAACVNFLMVSPVAKGLFHRAIIMSGSALSDWATANHPWQATMQISQSLGCPMMEEEMAECLRKKKYQEILKARKPSAQFSTQFGPVIDNLVVPNTPHKVMGQYSDIFSRYDLLFGVTELESYHILNAVALLYGLLETEKDNLLRFYMQNRFEIRPDLALAATLREYTDIYTDPNKALADEHRDTLLEILSDARVTAPVVQMGLYHTKVNPRSYMYVFGHNSEAGEYADLSQSVTGEELAYVFGAPLAEVGPFQSHYNPQERLFSEAIMKYWTNFAKTGNPKAPWKDLFFNLNPSDWQLYDIDWPEFNKLNHSYLNLGIPPVVDHKYRQKYMKFWNQGLPEELKKITSMKQPVPYANFFTPSPSTSTYQRRGTLTTNSDIINGHINLYPSDRNPKPITEDPYRTLKILLEDPLSGHDKYNSQDSTVTTTLDTQLDDLSSPHHEIVKSETTFYLLIGVIVIFVILNIIVITYMWNKNNNKKKLKRKFNNPNFEGTEEELKRSKLTDGEDSFIMDIVRKSGNNTYEPVKTSYSPINGFKFNRQMSTSTVDAHTKVVDWISQEIAKYSPKNHKKSLSPTVSIKSKSFLVRPKKVSVSVDATPQARSNSVLRQEPIEVTKAKSNDNIIKDIIICQEIDFNESLTDRNRRNSSISLNDISVLKIDHKHSRSDPVQMYYNNEDITSFIENDDINVTSRDNEIIKDPLTPEESLKTIQRRNYPKVLPDYPNENQNNLSAAMKRRSLPLQHFMLYNGSIKSPPAPPIRTTSTLGRRPSNRRISKNITTSPLMFAEEPPDVIEPEITSNSLHFGPLIPKEGIYSTARRKTKEEVQIAQDSKEREKPKIIIKPGLTKQHSDRQLKDNITHVQIPQESNSKIPTLKSNKDRAVSDSSSNSTESSTGTAGTTGTVKKFIR